MKPFIIPIEVNQIIKTLNQNGYEAYIVGGCVRDFLLGYEPKDWDITTSALPLEVKNLFRHTYDTGIKHGTITILLNNKSFEVTTYRIEGDYKDFRHPENVIFTDKINNDLSRRDFTMNSIAYHEKNGFVDPFCGRYDIEKKIIRGVGNADKRFKEDALRMMRAVRFSAQLNFKIEQNTFNAILKNSNLIKNISIERIREEFIKLIISNNPEKIIILKYSGLLQYFLPEVSDILKDKYYSICCFLKNSNKDISLCFAFLLYFVDESKHKNIMSRMKFDNKTIKETVIILKYSKYTINTCPYEIRKLISVLGINLFEKLINLKNIIALSYENLNCIKKLNNIYSIYLDIIKNNDCLSIKNLAVNGNTLKDIGIKDGKKIGAVLNYLFENVLKNPENNKENILVDIIKKYNYK